MPQNDVFYDFVIETTTGGVLILFYCRLRVGRQASREGSVLMS